MSKTKKSVPKQIEKSEKEIKDIMQINLSIIAESMINQIIKNANKLPNAQILKSIKDIKPKGINAYKSELKTVLSVVSSEALDNARLEIPSAKKVKLMENEESLMLGEFEKLPPGIKKRINTANDLLIGTQIADLEKAIFFQFTSSVNAEKPMKEIKADMDEKAESYITGNAIRAGAAVTAATTVNDVRNAFFFNDETLQQIDAFQFMNGDPVSAICNDLAGTIFKKNDPDHFKYTPPLHYNAILENELIKTNHGDIKIQDIKIGDMVLTHKNNYKKVYETMNKFEDKEYFEMILENGNKLCLTGEHPILTDRGWKRMDQVLLTDDIICFEDICNPIII